MPSGGFHIRALRSPDACPIATARNLCLHACVRKQSAEVPFFVNSYPQRRSEYKLDGAEPGHQPACCDFFCEETHRSVASVLTAHCAPFCAGMKDVWCASLLVVPAVAQKLAPFDAASASTVYSTASFGAELATSESSGHGLWLLDCCLFSVAICCNLLSGTGVVPGWTPFFLAPCALCVGLSCALVRRSHLPGEVVAWTGSFMSRRELLGIKLRWSYAPAEVKVLTSADSGNFEEASGWRRTARTERSFEETMFATPVSVKAVKVLMRGAKPCGYFGLSTVAAVAAPYSFMLVSGAAAIHEQCVVSTPAGLSAKPCVDAIVAGDGHEVFALTSAGSWQG